VNTWSASPLQHKRHTVTAYSTKAAHYARYRWHYAVEAILTLVDVAQLGPTSVIADVGAGTGILSRQLADQCSVKRIYAIEPNHEMRALAQEQLAPYACCTVLDGTAEAIPLPDRCVDLIAVAQAIHWFEPEAAHAEFRRISRPGGWLALLRNYGTDEVLGRVLAALMVEENGVEAQHTAQRPGSKPSRYYCGGAPPLTRTFPFVLQEPWETFLGSLCSASFTPNEDHPFYARFEHEARKMFSRLSVDGLLAVRGETELITGHV
jgi:SAM-dependent methyltransferase